MNREREIFAALLECKTPEERLGYLRGACGDDEALFQLVQALLEAHDEAGDFLPASPGGDDVLDRDGVGTTVGRYKLLEQIGEGGFGTVYMAEQREPVRRRVALKIIKLGMDTKQVVGRFEAERQALALMDHPNIAKVFDAGATETGRPYFVMELIRGVPLIDYCDEQRLTTGARLDMFVTICEAVQHAHQKGIIHRDLKPSNIMVSMDGDKPVPKIIDFGIAKATQQDLTDKTLFTRYQEFIGTPAYMSPEQAQMSTLDIDTRSDVYALGVLLYQLLTGQTPFDRDELLSGSHEDIRRRIREDAPPKPSARLHRMLEDDRTTVASCRQIDSVSLHRQVQGELDWIVMKALEKERSQRYESASAFARDVQRYLNDEPVQAAAPSTLYRGRKFCRRHWKPMTAIGAFVSLLAIGAIVSTILAIRAQRAEQLSDDRLKQAEFASKQAEQQSAIAAAVNRFLNRDLLAQANPEGSPDGEVPLRAVLERAGERVEGAFPDQPIVEASIRTTLGRTFLRLDRAPKAEEH